MERTKTPMKEIKKKLHKWGHIPYLWIGRFSIVKMLIVYNLIYRLNVILINVAASYSINNNKVILKLCGKIQV